MSPAKLPAERSLIASIAADVSWARTVDRPARTAAARKALADRFEARVPAEIIDPVARVVAAENLRRAYYKALALKSAQARRARHPKNRGGA